MTFSPRSLALAICLAFSALASACYSPSVPDGTLQCSPSGACPDGYQCATNGYCFHNGAAVPPDAPTGVSAIPGVRSATISWSAPVKDGGSAITNYTVTASPGGLTASSMTTSVSLVGLDNGTAYTFTVVATNAIGDSVASSPSSPVTTFGFPGAPTALIAAAITNGATLDWTAPADSGGTPVTGYIVQVSLNGSAFIHVSPSISGTHASISGLSGGGSYTFEVAAVNAVGAGDFSLASSAITLADVPVTPTITAPAAVSSGQTGVSASVTANLGETYAWTITGGTLTNPDGAAGEIGSGVDAITFTVTADPGDSVVLTCVATNAVGNSPQATFTASVSSAPVQPAITAATFITIGDTNITASVVARAGMTYNWTLSSNASLVSGDLHGVTSGGTNSITYNLSVNAQVGDQVQLSAVEVNPSQQMSTAGTAAQQVVAAPSTPVITAPQMVAVGELGASASVPDNSSMTYLWTLTGATFSAGSGAAGTDSGGVDSIQFDVTAAVSGNVVLSVVEINQAQKQSAPASVTVPVGALPSPLSISVALDNGASPAQFQSGANQYVTLNRTATAQVASVPGATYAWTITGGTAANGDPGTSRSFSFIGTSASTPIQLGCTVALGSSNVQGAQTVTVVAAPGTPAISIDGNGATSFIELSDTSSHGAAITSPVSTSSYAWTATPASDLLGLAASGTSVTFTLSSTAQAADAIVFHAIETNAAGRAGTAGSATLNVLTELQTPVVAASNAAVAPGQSYTASATPAESGATYHWAIAEVVSGAVGTPVDCPSSTGTTCTVNSDHSISFTADASLPTDGTTALELQLTVSNQAGDSLSATPVDLEVISLPQVNVQFGTPPAGDLFGANISTGGTREAFVPSGALTYLWTVGASSGATILSGATSDAAIISAGTAAAETTIPLSITATNAAGSATASSPLTVVASPSAPSIAVAALAGNPADPNFTNAMYVASLTAGTPAGSSYTWTVTASDGSACVTNTSICGITLASGANPSSGTFSYEVIASAGSTLTFSAVAADTAGDSSAASNTATQLVVSTPSINSTFAIPGFTAAAFSKFAPGAQYTLSIGNPRTGATYAWTLGGAACPGASGCTDQSGGAFSSITFTDGSNVTSDQNSHSPPQPGDTVTVRAAEANAGGAAISSAALVVQVIAAPATQSIVLTDLTGDVIDTTDTQLAPQEMYDAYVDSSAGLGYLWTATSTGSANTIIDSSTPASGKSGTDASANPTNFVTIDVPAFTSGESVNVGVTIYNAAALTPATLSVAVAGTAGAVIAVPDVSTRTPPSLTYGATGVAVDVTPDLNPNSSPMSFSCSTDANSSIVGSATASPLSLTVASSPTLLSGSSISTTITCVETAAGGAMTTSSLVVQLSPPISVTITPVNGATNVGLTVAPALQFSDAPNPSTLTSTGSCSGNITLVNGDDASCVVFVLTPSGTNSFTLAHAVPLESGGHYTLTVGSGVTDQQGAPIVAQSIMFTAHNIPAVTAQSATMHLQSADLSWTNPTSTSDALFNHVHITAVPADSTRGEVTLNTDAAAAASSITLTGLSAGTGYTFSFQSADTADDSQLGAAVTTTGATALSGQTSDFTSSQLVTGLSPSLNGGDADSFFFTWGPSELYFGFAQADGDTALRNEGDAVWIGIDVDAAGADSNGDTSTATSGTLPSTVARQLIWPFRADYVLELKNTDGTTIASRLLNVATSTWNSGPDAVVFNGAIAEVGAPSASLAPVGGGSASHVRLAMAFLNFSGGSGDATVIDVTPSAASSVTTDGHTPATDVLGGLGSITNSINLPSITSVSGAGQPFTSATLQGAAALVTIAVDASAEGFTSNDTVHVFGSLPPLSYTLADSYYQLHDDGTSGDAATDGVYTGVFNFGIFSAEPAGSSANELFFEFTDTNVTDSVITNSTESPFGGGKDRVWTLSGGSEKVGSDPIAWAVVYSLTHTMTLNFTVNQVPVSETKVVILGDQDPIGDWNSPFNGTGMVVAGVMLSNLAATATYTGSVMFTDMDFVSGSSSCAQNVMGTPDAPGCWLNWQAVGYVSPTETDYESTPNNNHTMNDDVINRRLLEWNWGDISSPPQPF